MYSSILPQSKDMLLVQLAILNWILNCECERQCLSVLAPRQAGDLSRLNPASWPMTAATLKCISS